VFEKSSDMLKARVRAGGSNRADAVGGAISPKGTKDSKVFFETWCLGGGFFDRL